MTDDLVKWLRELGEHPCRSELPMGVGLRQAAIVLESLEAEVERLNNLINETANHWLRLQCDHPVGWVGAIDTAMEAACDEIRRLSAALKGTEG